MNPPDRPGVAYFHAELNDPVDLLLRRLDARLYGPRRARRELLAEVADGLADAERRYPEASRLWGLLWSVVPRQAPPTPAEVAWLYPMYQAATLVSVVGAVLGLALLVRGARRGRSPGAVVVLLGVAGALAVALNLTASVSHAIVARSPAEVIENSPLAVVIYVVTVLVRTREWRVAP